MKRFKIVRGHIYKDKYSGKYLVPRTVYGIYWYGNYFGQTNTNEFLGRSCNWDKPSKEEIKKAKLEML